MSKGRNRAAFDASLRLAQHIRNSFQKIEAVINNVPRWGEIDRLLTLRRIANFWPIIINTYADCTRPKEEQAFRCILRLCEITSLKIWGIGDYRSDKAQPEFIRIAQQEGGNRQATMSRMKDVLKWWDIPNRWQKGLDSEAFYHQGRDARYILFEYENYLRDKRGYTRVPFSDFGEMTIEHIAARRGEENVERLLLEVGAPDVPHGTIQADSEAKTTNLLHHIGNLVIDPRSPNAGKGNLPVNNDGKLPWFRAAPYLSQLELANDLTANGGVWDAGVIRLRGKKLAEFAMQRWDEDGLHGGGCGPADTTKTEWSEGLKARTRDVIEGGMFVTRDGHLHLKHVVSGFGVMTEDDVLRGVLRVVDVQTGAETTFASADELIAAGWAID